MVYKTVKTLENIAWQAMKSMVNLKHTRFKDLGKGECKMENMVNVLVNIL